MKGFAELTKLQMGVSTNLRLPFRIPIIRVLVFAGGVLGPPDFGKPHMTSRQPRAASPKGAKSA